MPTIRYATAFVGLLLGCLGTVSAQSVFAWTQASPSASPSVRADHAMAFDSARGRAVMFGGAGPNGTLGDTWEWDGNTWLAAFSPAFPSARSGHSMAYDSHRQRTVLFGGSTVAETWEWTGSNWLLMSTSGPSPRFDAAMAYDSARQRTVLFGGGWFTGALGDTWEWDGATWTQIVATGPAARSRAAMAFDSLRGRSVLFGGAGSSTILADTWEWDGAAWIPAAGGPTWRLNHSMCFDSARGKTILFGGTTSGASLSDAWDYDGVTWQERSQTGWPSTLGIHSAATVFDSQRGETVLFGGSTPFSYSGATWVLVARDTASATPFGPGCGTPALALQPEPAHPPITNTTAFAAVANAPTPFGAAMIGFSKTQYGPFSLPVTLGFIGMTGCDLLQSADIQGWPLTATSATTLSLSAFLVPTPTLVGRHIYLQVYVYAPGANPLEILMSNGLDWYVGNV